MRLEPADGFPHSGAPALCWLGQAGFWIDTGAHRVLIDPYLSDSLARKYAGTAHPHIRMMPPPLSIADLPRPDLVLVSHAHTDHMDPDTLGPLYQRFRDLPFVVPAAVEDIARERIGQGADLRPVVAQEHLTPLEGLSLEVFPAAHEARARDKTGRDSFLGYGLAVPGMRLYHSGDSIPFAELDAQVQGFAPDLALLPVNGRDEARRRAGIPGNFTLKEAQHLARSCAFLIPHHFDMFAFNTLDPAEIDAAAARSTRPQIIRPAPGRHLRIRL